MRLTKEEIKGILKGIILGIGTWWIALPWRDYILEVSPIKNTMVLGAIMIFIALIWD